jgi:hypothetical protein
MKTFFAILIAIFTYFALVQSAPIDFQALEARNLEARRSGQGTYYEVGLGSCGKKNNNNQMVCALSGSIMNKSYCGKTITVKSLGKSYSCTVVDTCPGCSSGSVDMSPKLFQKFAPLSKGVIPITWS